MKANNASEGAGAVKSSSAMSPPSPMIDEKQLVDLEMSVAITKRHGLRMIALHGVMPGNMCTCGSAACFHPGKHGVREGGAATKGYTSSTVCGFNALPHDHNLGAIIGDRLLVNVDATHGGHETANELFKHALGSQDDVWTVFTPCGIHFWYRLPAGATLKSNHVFLGPGLSALSGPDVYGILPPSIGQDGRSYSWAVDPKGDTAVIPDEVFKVIQAADNERRGMADRALTQVQLAQKVHQDFCDKLYHVEFDTFREVWYEAAKIMEANHYHYEWFVPAIASSFREDVVVPEDLLNPAAHAVARERFHQHGVEAVQELEYGIQGMIDTMNKVNTGNARDAIAGRKGYQSNITDQQLPSCIVALYACHPLKYELALSQTAPVVLDEWNDSELLAQQLIKKYFVHPGELRARLQRVSAKDRS